MYKFSKQLSLRTVETMCTNSINVLLHPDLFFAEEQACSFNHVLIHTRNLLGG